MILTSSALVPAFVLIVSRLFGWFGLSGGGPMRYATDSVSFGAGWVGGLDLGHSVLVVVVTLVITGLAVYFGAGGLDERRGAAGAFVLG
jgi:hypothetical protein